MRAYHLLSAEHALSNIALKRIKIATVSDLNDPFELLSVSLGAPAVRKGLIEFKQRWAREMGMLCFSADWESPVLWSHYAAKHTGMALGFEIADECVAPVRYVPERISLPARESLGDWFAEHLLLAKFEHWHYENEVRMVVPLALHPVERGLYFYSFAEQLQLREVVLGPLCEIPIEAVSSMLAALYDEIEIVKAAPAYKWFKVVPGGPKTRVGRAAGSSTIPARPSQSHQRDNFPRVLVHALPRDLLLRPERLHRIAVEATCGSWSDGLL